MYSFTVIRTPKFFQVFFVMKTAKEISQTKTETMKIKRKKYFSFCQRNEKETDGDFYFCAMKVIINKSNNNNSNNPVSHNDSEEKMVKISALPFLASRPFAF